MTKIHAGIGPYRFFHREFSALFQIELTVLKRLFCVSIGGRVTATHDCHRHYQRCQDCTLHFLPQSEHTSSPKTISESHSPIPTADQIMAMTFSVTPAAAAHKKTPIFLAEDGRIKMAEPFFSAAWLSAPADPRLCAPRLPWVCPFEEVVRDPNFTKKNWALSKTAGSFEQFRGHANYPFDTTQ
jgi:hypothetical protein